MDEDEDLPVAEMQGPPRPPADRDAILDMFSDTAEDVQFDDNHLIKAPAAPKETPNAIEVDRWGKRIAKRITEEWNLAGEDADTDDLKETEAMVADAHTSCFEPRPQLTENCADAVKATWFNDLLQSDDFRSLHASTRMDTELSQIAAKQLFDRFEQYKASLTEQEKEEIEEEQEESKEGGGDSPGPVNWGPVLKRKRSIEQASQAAAKDVADAQDAMDSFGGGIGTGDGSGADTGQNLLKMFEMLRDNPQWRKISENAGRFRRLAKSLQRQKPVHGVDDMVGVTLDDNISRLVPAELMNLTNRYTKLDLIRRLSEKQAACREYQGIESTSRGPIMILVDESGSMSGNPIAAAKGFALSMSWLARQQKRWCCLVGWSSGGQIRKLLVDPHKSTDQIMDWCVQFWNGGTQPPFEEVPRLFLETGAPKGQTDVIWVTDGEIYQPDDPVLYQAFRKEQKVKVWTIGIGCSVETFRPYSDVVTSVTGLNTGTPIIGELLSL